ncbi:MAG: inorganic phosphate transporter [Clostridia bacterium]|nr:inorganic phosphate transporter [Clostridia bacterium]
MIEKCFCEEMCRALNDVMSIVALILSVSVVFLNGFTDAPNSIAACVGTKALEMKKACTLCAIFNFFGAFLTMKINASVVRSVFELADFGGKMTVGAVASLSSVCVFSLVAWLFSMPSSESHALVGGIAGASIAISGTFQNYDEFLKILGGVAVSCTISFFISFLICLIFKKKTLPYKELQIGACALSSFSHGAQDSQKFVGIIMLMMFGKKADFAVPVSIILMVSIVMALGAVLGGGRIVRTLSEKTVKLCEKSAFSSDIASFISAIASSFLGIPVSTSNIKACALMGAGKAMKEKINKRTAASLLLTTLLTFPVCILIGFIVAKILLNI